VAVDIDLQNSANPYGAIIESSGRLVVKARRLATILIFSPEQFGGTLTWATSFRVNETGGLFKILTSVDSLDEARKAADDGGTDLLELSSLCTDQKWSTRGLVVGDMERIPLQGWELLNIGPTIQTAENQVRVLRIGD
jgi:hypothetical protein